MEVSVISTEQLVRIIRAELSRAQSSKTEPQQQPDRCNFNDALEITGLSKSALYKKTASKDIPHKRFGNRLVFSRKSLLEWVESQTVDANDTSEIELALAKSARRKKKGGANA